MRHGQYRYRNCPSESDHARVYPSPSPFGHRKFSQTPSKHFLPLSLALPDPHTIRFLPDNCPSQQRGKETFIQRTTARKFSLQTIKETCLLHQFMKSNPTPLLVTRSKSSRRADESKDLLQVVNLEAAFPLTKVQHRFRLHLNIHFLHFHRSSTKQSIHSIHNSHRKLARAVRGKQA